MSVNIFEYRDEFENGFRDCDGDLWEWKVANFCRDCLEVRVFTETTGDDGWWKHTITEFLITYGGPTVRLTIDSRYKYGELFHSWGVDHVGDKREVIQISDEITELFDEVIERSYK